MASKPVARLFFITACLSALLVILIAAWQIHWAIYRPLALPEPAVTVAVEQGDTLTSTIRHLADTGIVRYPQWLLLFARTQKQTAIRAGEYRVESPANGKQLLALLVSGKVIQYQITFIEGSRFADNLAQLANNSKLVNDIAQLDENGWHTLFGFGPHEAEGRFFPDTYTYVKGTRISGLLRQSRNRMEEILNDEWEKRDKGLPYSHPYQALVMASIVEKETGIASERPEIAGVFVRRLKKGMKLQTDPTVIYGMGQRFNGDITRNDLKTYSPWNTYMIDGLPPTPIAMPGRDAIHAALHPARGNALYFVARGDGTHEFSETLTEHDRAVAKYQLQRKAGAVAAGQSTAQPQEAVK